MKIQPRRLLTFITIAMLIAGCDSAVPEYRATHYVFGTLVEFTVYDSDAETARQAIADIGADFRTFHNDWHAWQPGKLTRLNELLADGQPHPLDPGLIPLFEQSIVLSRKSQGLFNPAMGRLIALWGFHNDTPPVGPPPNAREITRLVNLNPQMSDLVLSKQSPDQATLRSNNPAGQYDFGGFAKGYAIELAQQKMQSAGIANAIVNAGGDLCVMGDHGDRPWRIAIRDPRHFDVLAEIALTSDECAMTSGNYERFREYNDRRYAHIIDPRTGWPVDHIASATVIANDGGMADAAATALTVAGPEKWQTIAQQMELTQALLVDDTGRIHVSRSLYPRLIWPEKAPTDLVIVDL